LGANYDSNSVSGLKIIPTFHFYFSELNQLISVLILITVN
jgi:hypothetical protein